MIECGECNKRFENFKEGSAENINEKVPCCPYCGADVLGTVFRVIEDEQE